MNNPSSCIRRAGSSAWNRVIASWGARTSAKPASGVSDRASRSRSPSPSPCRKAMASSTRLDPGDPFREVVDGTVDLVGHHR
jgi:hypothetical protein